MPHPRPRYLAVFAMFVRNSAVREMSFRSNFIIQCASSACWMTMLLFFYLMLFQYTQRIVSQDAGGGDWGKYEFLIFLATTMLVNGLMQALVMPNADQFSELIRTGNLDFVLLKPIDTQFLVSLCRVDYSALTHLAFGLTLLIYSLRHVDFTPAPVQFVLFPVYLLCGVGILYSVVITLAASSVWMGRNQSLYDFWFYITTFSRYPIEIYSSRTLPMGDALQWTLTYVLPILIAVNVPARLLAWPLSENQWHLAIYAIAATAASLLVARLVFKRALASYRSASS